jgi:hypothetical protein
MGDWLSEALEREGFSEHELICVRSVHSRVRIELAATDENIAAKWALNIAAAIRSAAESGSANVARYRSRSHALIDLLQRTLEGDFSRSWVWRQLGLASFSSETASAKDLLGEALRSEPQLLAPILVHLALKGSLPVLLGKLSLRDWESLAATAWFTAGGSTLPQRTFEPAVAEPARSRAARILRKSAIAGVIRKHPGRWTSELCWVLAVFAFLECDSSAVASGTSHTSLIASVVATVATEFVAQPRENFASNVDLSANSGKPPTDSGKALTSRSSKPRVSDSLDSSPEAQAVIYESRFGGLLLILQLCSQLELFPRLVEAFPERTLSWTMQQIALRLVPARENDPAVLAFAGCVPQDVSPSRDELAPNLVEESALAGFITTITEELEGRLSDLELKGDRLLSFVCHRWCRIEADPGWIQIHFSLTDVSTDIRRAALDLDPGYIRALGVTVVFHYE